MSVTAAYSTTIKRQGTSTAFTNEPTTRLTANTVYQIASPTKTVVDPAVAVVVEVDTGGGYATAAASAYVFDYLAGTVTFASDQGGSAVVRVSGSYLPLLTVAEATEYSYSLSCNLLDATTFDSSGYMTRLPAVFNGTVTLKGLKLPTYDMDPGGGTKKFESDLTGRTPLLLEIAPPTATGKFRAWVVAKGSELGGGADAIVQNSLEFELAARLGSGQTEDAAWTWAVDPPP